MILLNRTIGKPVSYLRLSRDDGDKLESDSIHSQREMIQQFLVKSSQPRTVREYVDDGFSGTNFERPGFLRMIAEAKRGVFDCIIVKDLSRLGRNYIETGKYIERIFPAMGIRLIAINDNYDSLDKASADTDVVVPFKNLINDAYCRDISLKIRSHLDVKRKDGQFIGSFAAYGYMKDPENKNHLLIDPYAAEIVELIFDLRLEGYSSLRIAEQLDQLGVQPPYEYKRKQGFNYNSGFRSTDKAKWQVETINRILSNEMYLGKMVQGKTKKVNYKVKKSVAVSPIDWIRVEDTHDAIISNEKFETVQRINTLDTRVAPTKEEVYPLCGYVVCGECGQNMVRRSSRQKGKNYFYYHCSTYKKGDGCSSHMVNCDKVEKVVVNALHQHIMLVDKVEKLLNSAEEAASDRACIRMIEKQKEQLKSEIEHYGNIKAKLYRDMSEGLIEKEEYTQLNDRFSTSRKRVEQSLRDVEAREEMILKDQMKFLPWVKTLKKYRSVTQLTRSLVVSTIERVVIHSKTEIEIHFQFEDELRELLEIAGERKEA